MKHTSSRPDHFLEKATIKASNSKDMVIPMFSVVAAPVHCKANGNFKGFDGFEGFESFDSFESFESFDPN